MTDLTECAKNIFAGDKFAGYTGIIIEYAEEFYSRCSFDAQPFHYNANGVVMGGALFTLADFAYTVAANTAALASGQPPCVTVTSDIRFLSPARGGRLTAEAKCLRAGKTVCAYSVKITDSEGRLIADVGVTGVRAH